MSTMTLQIQATPEFVKSVEDEAARLNLTVSAYFLYLRQRLGTPDAGARLDRHVREVFGRHGDLMRRLAK